jgi:ribosomal protein L37E
VFNELEGLAWEIIEARGYENGHGQSEVVDLIYWIDRQLDWVTRQETVGEFEMVVRTVNHKLMPLTGDPRIFVCKCPNPIDDGEKIVPCGANLYYPRKGDTIACGNPDCRRRWRAHEWHSRDSEGLSSMVRALNGIVDSGDDVA